MVARGIGPEGTGASACGVSTVDVESAAVLVRFRGDFVSAFFFLFSEGFFLPGVSFSSAHFARWPTTLLMTSEWLGTHLVAVFWWEVKHDSQK
jgi:hypothetical protein